MVALARLGGPALSADREMEIWRYANNGSQALPGSFPGRLAIYAQAQGCRVSVVEDHAKLEAIFRLSTRQERFPGLDPMKALQEHDLYLKEAEEKGIRVARKPTTLQDVADLAVTGPVLMLVSTAADVSGLHWVLLQSFDPATGLCTLMDPGLGKNFVAPLEVFRKHYDSVHPFLGVAIALSGGI
jgi:hypothetical protein